MCITFYHRQAQSLFWKVTTLRPWPIHVEESRGQLKKKEKTEIKGVSIIVTSWYSHGASLKEKNSVQGCYWAQAVCIFWGQNLVPPKFEKWVLDSWSVSCGLKSKNHLASYFPSTVNHSRETQLRTETIVLLTALMWSDIYIFFWRSENGGESGGGGLLTPTLKAYCMAQQE